MQILTDRLLIRPIEAADWPAVRDIWAALAPLPMAQYDKPFDTRPESVQPRIARWAEYTALGTAHMFFAVCLHDAVIGYISCNQRDDGHEIGYSFHPAHHGKGYAKEMLRLNIQNAKALGIPQLLITCDVSNVASEKTILANGGVYEKTIEVDGNRLKRYWITV